MPSALAGWMKGWTELGMPPERLSLKLGSLRELLTWTSTRQLRIHEAKVEGATPRKG